MHHTTVCRHIGEEHQRQTAGEQTRTATELQTLVTEDVPSKADTWRNDKTCVRPFAGIDMSAIVVQFVYCIVSHQVTVVEEQTIETQTVSKFEFLTDVPLILSIDTNLVELHTCSRLGLAVVTVSKVDDFRSSTAKEVIETCITIVTGTVTHIHIVSHLVFESHTAGNLMVGSIISDIILEVINRVVNRIVPREQFITKRDVALVVLEDINERELIGICSTHIIELRESEQELVGQLISEAAVQIDRNRMHEVVDSVHRVGV